LLAVYILALGVYTFTAGHYLGRALGVGSLAIAGLELAMVSALVVLNVLAVNNPIALQIGAVWLQLVILAGVAIAGLVDFRVDALGAPGTLAGVIQAAALTFVAFEGFEMIAYDLRELRKPRRVMQRALPAAVIAVATAYVLVALGAASLVGADALIAHEDAALAVAGRAVAGTPGMIIVTLAACVAALTAVNATLFSAARLARTTAEHGLLPHWCARCNRHSAPTWSTIVIGVGAFAFAATMPLEVLVGLASIGFLGLFCLVNAVAYRRKTRRRFIAAFGALTSAAGVAVITWTYVS
jgi:amino acid transporter